MTSATLHDLTGISILIGEPLYSSRSGGVEVSYTHEMSAYSHKRAAFLDSDKATLELRGDHLDIEDWIQFGLGRDVQVFDASLEAVFKGFVNIVEIITGGVTVKIGPLMGIGNRVSVVYAILDNTTNPPTVGDRTVTTIAQDADSQAKYGIIEKAVSAGQISTAEANQLRDAYLEENKLPETSQGLNSISSTDGIAIRLEILGYGYWLDAFIYNQTIASGTTQVSAKMQAVLVADPNNIISSDYSRIIFNGLLVSAYENDDPRGLTVIKELVTFGDVGYDRYLFQIDTNLRAAYIEQPTDWEYQMAISENQIRTSGGAEIMPWAIKPGKWLFLNDFLTGRSTADALRTDPRMVFVESIDYTAPYEFSIEGSKSNTFKQIISQFGMKGLVS